MRRIVLSGILQSFVLLTLAVSVAAVATESANDDGSVVSPTVASSSSLKRALQGSSSGENESSTSSSSNGGRVALAQLPLWLSIWTSDVQSSNDNENVLSIDRLVDMEQGNAFRDSIVVPALQELLCTATMDVILVDTTTSTSTSATSHTEFGTNICSAIIDADADAESSNQKRRLNVPPHQRQQRHDHRSIQQSNSTEETILSVLDATPSLIEVRARENSNFYHSGSAAAANSVDVQWAVWTVTWTVLQMGSVYINEAAMQSDETDGSSNGGGSSSGSNTSQDDMQAASLEAMQQVLQLALDVVAMDGTLDVLLAKYQQRVTSATATQSTTTESDESMSSLTILSSPLRHELERFSDVALSRQTSSTTNNNNNNVPHEPRTWYPMRIAGLVILVTTVAWVWGLASLAKRRRIKLLSGDKTTTVSTGDGTKPLTATGDLKSPSAVDAMLSSTAAAAAATTTATTTTALGGGTMPLSILHEEPSNSSAFYDHSSSHHMEDGGGGDNPYNIDIKTNIGLDSSHNTDDGDDADDERTNANDKKDPGRYWTGHVVVQTSQAEAANAQNGAKTMTPVSPKHRK